MTESPRGNYSKEYVCKADISSRLTERDDIAEANLVCRSNFCTDMISGTAYSVGDTANEAELNAEFTMREIVRLACPQWKAVREAGLAPGEGDELPDQYMPPFK